MKKKTTVKPMAFSRLNEAGKRIAIAKDVINQIRMRKFNIEEGNWAQVDVKSPRIGQHELLHGFSSTQKSTITCTCCAVGAAFLSSIRMANVAEVKEGFIEKENAFDQLKKFFSIDQIEKIEQAFEVGLGGCGNDDQPSVDFGEKYSKPDKRALAIFQNIVKNKGEFVP